MKYTGTIYRPPLEANTLLLQVTVGCTHNNCAFCTMYQDTQFSIESIEQIEKDLQEAKLLYGSQKRIFLVNADPFALKAWRLKEISDKIIDYFPEMETITMYASIRNIKHKTDKELLELKEARINDLWVGIESGNDEVLEQMNKGFTKDEAYTQLTRLTMAGIRHNGIFMLGAAGKSQGIKAATDTALLINKVKPQLVGVTTLGFFEGSKLLNDVSNNLFEPATELEVFEEEKKLIQLIDLPHLPFYGDHPINAAYIAGTLPEDRDDMIATINDVIESTDAKVLYSSALRTAL